MRIFVFCLLAAAALVACDYRESEDVQRPPIFIRDTVPHDSISVAQDEPLALTIQFSRPIQRGEVQLVQPGPAQHHLLIALGNDSYVHAHAGLRKTVIQTLNPADPPLRRWRLGADPECVWQP